MSDKEIWALDFIDKQLMKEALIKIEPRMSNFYANFPLVPIQQEFTVSWKIKQSAECVCFGVLPIPCSASNHIGDSKE